MYWCFTVERHGPAGQGYCQGGFSADFTKVGETFSHICSYIAVFVYLHSPSLVSVLVDVVGGNYTVYIILSVCLTHRLKLITHTVIQHWLLLCVLYRRGKLSLEDQAAFIGKVSL